MNSYLPTHWQNLKYPSETTLFRLIGLLAFLLISFLPNFAYAVPIMTTYQGHLADASGNPLNITVSMTFALYDTPVGGTPLWMETHPNVIITQGVFSVVLGSIVNFEYDDIDGERYVSMTIEDDAEMMPREPLTSVIFAMRAGIAESIVDGAVTGAKIADLTGHSVLELDDIHSVGSGAIITHEERERWNGLKNSIFQPNDDEGYYTASNLGISTKTPMAKLDVNGSTVLRNRIQIGNAHSTWFNNAITGFFEPAASSDAFLLVPGYTSVENSDLRLYVLDNTEDRFSIWGNSCVDGSCDDINKASVQHFFTGGGDVYHAGKVGIGTMHPLATLDINGGIKITGNHNEGWPLSMTIQVNPDTNAMKFTANTDFHFDTGTSANALYIHQNGNVGIGTVKPATQLHVTKYGNVSVEAENTNAGSGFAQFSAKSAKGAIVTVLSSQGDTGQGNVGTNSNHPFSIQTNAVPRMTVDIAGNVGIGTTIPQYQLDVAGTIRGNNVSPSDQRLKQNIQPLENSLTKIEQLQGVRFEWKNAKPKTGSQIGVIAQEVETVLPELVSTDSEGYKSVAYDKLTAVLIEAVKELKAENATLRTETQTLKAIICEDHPEKAICQ